MQDMQLSWHNHAHRHCASLILMFCISFLKIAHIVQIICQRIMFSNLYQISIINTCQINKYFIIHGAIWHYRHSFRTFQKGVPLRFAVFLNTQYICNVYIYIYIYIYIYKTLVLPFLAHVRQTGCDISCDFFFAFLSHFSHKFDLEVYK